eukprot:gene31665-38268_t
MLLSDIQSLKQVLRNTSVITADGNRYNESVDVDIERMYAGSPTLQEWPTVYNFDQMYQVETESTACANCPPKASLLWPNDSQSSTNDFRPRPIGETAPSTQQSLLTKLIEESKANRPLGKPKTNGLPFVIYLPDTSSMTVYVRETGTFGDLLKVILEEHKRQNLQPPLNYSNLDLYELRMHDSDGEPDRDFDPFSFEKTLKEYDMDEYCLCYKDGGGSTPPPMVDMRFSSPSFAAPPAAGPDRSSTRMTNVFQSMDFSGRGS